MVSFKNHTHICLYSYHHCLTLDLFDASVPDLTAIVMDATTPYLDEFLRQIRGGTASTPSAKKNRCKKWIAEPADRRKYILKKPSELQQIYTSKHGKPHKSSWSAATLITEILKDSVPQEDVSFEQDMMNTIVGNGVLPQLSKDAAESCAKGHELEPVYAAEIMKKAKAGEFGFGGTLEGVATVGTVQKRGKRYVKTSVDRMLCVNMGNEENPQRELMLLELKARVKVSTEQKEQDRIENLRTKGLLDDDDESKIYHEMSSDHPHSHLGIGIPHERLQALHHAFTYSKGSCIHAVGNEKRLLSICKMNFPEPLLASYERTVKFIHDSGLHIFYRDGGEDEIQANEEEMKRIEKAVEKHKDTYKDMYRFLFNYKLWRDLTDGPKLPLPPLLYLIPLALAWWNINKPSGDMITQMIWDRMYYSPVSNPQAVLVKRLGHQIPNYMCHRLFQLFNTSRDLSSFSSILQYRDTTRRGLSFFNSTVAVDALLVSMAKRYNPAQQLPPPPPAGAPLVVNQAVAGTFSMAGAFPVTSNTPLRNRKAWYEDPSNACHYVFQRRHSCIGGCVHIACDENRKPVDGKDKTCAECGKTGATWWCPQCHVFLHGLKPSARSLGPGEETTLMAAASQMRKRNSEGELINHYTQMSCSDKWHLQARTRAFSGTNSTSIVTVSVSQFDPSRHNVSTNLSFSDATMNTTDDEATSTAIEDNNNNDSDSNS